MNWLIEKMTDRNMRLTAWAAIFVMTAFTALLWMLVMTFPSKAQEGTGFRRYCYIDFWGQRQCEWKSDYELRETRLDNVYVPRGQRIRTTRKLYIQKPDRGHRHTYDGDKCKAFVTVVGDQYASEEGAKQEADKAWMQTARWQHGERYMARENADDATYECGRSSVGSVAGQIFHRCRLSAKPCRPDKQEAN